MGDVLALDQGNDAHAGDCALDIAQTNSVLEGLAAVERLQWVFERFGDRAILSSSFGVQSAVLLHMASRIRPAVPVVLVDTGYLFPETYRFVDELAERLDLNLRVYRPEYSSAWQEARHGRLWEQGLEGIERYNWMNKVEPMQRALSSLGAEAWISGIRRDQASSRANRDCAEQQNGRLKLHPIIDWNDRDVFQYLNAHDLPYHPLWHEGYTSVGDVHTTRRLADGTDEEETRFFGLKRECGLHEYV